MFWIFSSLIASALLYGPPLDYLIQLVSILVDAASFYASAVCPHLLIHFSLFYRFLFLVYITSMRSVSSHSSCFLMICHHCACALLIVIPYCILPFLEAVVTFFSPYTLDYVSRHSSRGSFILGASTVIDVLFWTRSLSSLFLLF